MSNFTFCHEIEMGVTRAKLHAFLCELENLAPLHPLIESITALPASPESPRARRYRVVDLIPFGPLRMRTAYTTSIEPVSDHEVHGQAWPALGIHLYTVYALEDRGDRTGVRESVTIRAPFGLRRLITRKARASHREMLEKMKALLEESEAREPRH